MSGLLRVPLFQDEVLLSFVTRLGKANGAPGAASFCRDLGVPYRGIVHGRADASQMLADLYPAEGARLSRHATVLLENHSVAMFDERFSMRLLAKNSLRFCPACLCADDGANERMPGTRRYRRAQWLFNQYRMCLDHKIALVNKGPFSTYGEFVQLIGNITPTEVSVLLNEEAPDLCVEQFIADRLLGQRRHGTLLDTVSLASALYSANVIGIAAKYGKYYLATPMTVESRATATAFGLTVFKAGEQSLYDALSDITASANEMATGLSRYGRLSYTLFSRSLGDEYDRVRSQITKHNAEEIARCKIKRQNSETAGLRISDIARKTGLSRYHVKMKLKAAG